MKHVVIVGAGVSGLAAAIRLQNRCPNVEVTLLEQRQRVGGNAWTERLDGFQVEIGPNGFLDNKPSTVQLCRDVGLGDRLLPASDAAGKNRYLFLGDRLRALPGSVGAFFGSDLLSWRGKLSFLAERLRGRREDSSDESVADFARRRAGKEAAEIFADALVTGIHGGDPALLSIRAAFPRLADMERQYGSVMKGMAAGAKQRRREAAARGEQPQRPRMWSFREGLRLMVEALRDRLVRPPVLGVTVRRLQRDAASGRWTVWDEGANPWPADAVLLTSPAYQQAPALADLDAELAERINGIAYNRIAVVALGYLAADVPGTLDGFGYIAPQRTRRDLLGVQWCSSIFPARAPDGTVLMRALCGGWHRGEVVGWEDHRLIAAVRSELKLAMGVTAAPRFQHITRWDRAIPQYQLGHLERVAWIMERAAKLPGLFLGGNAYHGVAVNDCTEQGELMAERIGRYLAETRHGDA